LVQNRLHDSVYAIFTNGDIFLFEVHRVVSIFKSNLLYHTFVPAKTKQFKSENLLSSWISLFNAFNLFATMDIKFQIVKQIEVLQKAFTFTFEHYSSCPFNLYNFLFDAVQSIQRELAYGG
jgi:hypothetical protein